MGNPPTLGDKLAQARKPLTGSDFAAAQRADRVRALEEELVGYERSGKTDRAKAVREQIAEFKKEPKGRAAAPSAEAIPPPPDLTHEAEIVDPGEVSKPPTDEDNQDPPVAQTAAEKRAARRPAKKTAAKKTTAKKA